jgi:agmatinase
MVHIDKNQFFGFPSTGIDSADVLIIPLPLEKTVSYGTGTAGGPKAILDASLQIEWFEEETGVDFQQAPKIHVLPPLSFKPTDVLEKSIEEIQKFASSFPGRFLLGLGGEHLVTYGMLTGMAENLHVENLHDVTLVHIDAHADLADKLGGKTWSHGTVMRRLWEKGCRLLQIGIRSLSREEFELASTGDRIKTFYAHQFPELWPEVIERLRRLEGKVYLSIDVDGLDPSIIPSTGTPQPNGLSWRQTMDVLRAVAENRSIDWFGADVVEFVPSPHPPGCDPTAARLVAKILAYRHVGRNP